MSEPCAKRQRAQHIRCWDHLTFAATVDLRCCKVFKMQIWSRLTFIAGIGMLFSVTGALFSSAGAQTRYSSQTEDMTIDDQPGLIAPDGEEGLPDAYRRQPVYYRTAEMPGTIVIDTESRFLYVIQSSTTALRYGIGVGRDGFQWSGLLRVSRKAEWPDWVPPSEMIERQPYLPRFMAGGPGNPLGARALYLGATVYRIHGTNQPETIGHAVSSGCFRLVNDDVIDLFNRTPVGTKVIIRHSPSL
jgi:lipoprotein-anchoring transpeptidase ErfK/SrfK